MKWIKSYKLFEANRYGYEGNIIDIDKNELQECINKIRDFFAFLISIPSGQNDIINLSSYRDGAQNTEEKYAYAAHFSDQLINNNAEEYEYDNIIGVLTKSLFKDYKHINNCLRLLKMNGNFDTHGYSVVFTNDVNFRTSLIKKGSKVNVPDNKEEVLIKIICYYIAHLETMGDSVLYGTGKKQHAPIFKELLINYCNYLLKYGRTGDLFSKTMTMEEVYSIVYDTITNSNSRYEILNSMKILQPDFYKKLTGIGDETSIDMAASMGDMGFTEGKKCIKTYKVFEAGDVISITTSIINKFNDMFGIVGFHMRKWDNNKFIVSFNYVQEDCIFKDLLYKLCKINGVDNPLIVYPVNVNNMSSSELDIIFKSSTTGAPNEPKTDKISIGYSAKSDSSNEDRYIHYSKGYLRSQELMNDFLKSVCGMFGNTNENTNKVFVQVSNLGQQNMYLYIPFIRSSIYNYAYEIFKNNYTGVDVPLDFLYKNIYDQVIKTGNDSYRYFNLMKGSKLYGEMVKLSKGSGIELTDDLTNMGFSD